MAWKGRIVKEPFNFKELRSSLVESKAKNEDNSLFDVVNSLINNSQSLLEKVNTLNEQVQMLLNAGAISQIKSIQRLQINLTGVLFATIPLYPAVNPLKTMVILTGNVTDQNNHPDVEVAVELTDSGQTVTAHRNNNNGTNLVYCQVIEFI